MAFHIFTKMLFIFMICKYQNIFLLFGNDFIIRYLTFLYFVLFIHGIS